MSRKSFCKVLLGGLCLLSLVGCRSWRQTVEVPVYIHDTTYVAKVQHDSTFIDRWHTRTLNGDTVYVHDSIYESHVEWKHDTLKVVEGKPVIVSKTETVEVEKPLTWWQKTQQKGFWALLVVALVCVAWKTRKIWSKLI